MRTKNVLMVVALGFFLMATTVHASLVTLELFTDAKVQATLVETGSFDGYSEGSWHTTIGPFNTFGFITPFMEMNIQTNSFDIKITTNFAEGDPNTYQTELGDMFFVTESGVFAIAMNSDGGFYSNVNPRHSTDVFPAQATAANISSYAYGKLFGYGNLGSGETMAPYVRIDEDADLMNTTNFTMASPKPYTYTISGDFDLLAALGMTSINQTFDVVLAPTCANSVLWARASLTSDPPGGGVVPEPGTIALLGLGLIGLFFGRKRFSRK